MSRISKFFHDSFTDSIDNSIRIPDIPVRFLGYPEQTRESIVPVIVSAEEFRSFLQVISPNKIAISGMAFILVLRCLQKFVEDNVESAIKCLDFFDLIRKIERNVTNDCIDFLSIKLSGKSKILCIIFDL